MVQYVNGPLYIHFMFQCIRFPVVSVGIIRWAEMIVSEPNIFSLSTDYCPSLTMSTFGLPPPLLIERTSFMYGPSVSPRQSADRDGEMASSELQATIEISLEFHKFYNVDLFQRG